MRRTPLIDVSVAGLLAALVTSLALTGCAPAPQPPVSPQPTLQARENLPLPPGAVLDPAAGAPATPFEPKKLDWEGSLRPVEAGSEEEPFTPNLDRIRARGRIIVGIDQSLYLLAFRDTATGELRGFEVDLAREIAHDIFKDLLAENPDANIIDFRFVDSADRSELLRQGGVDVIIRTMSITPERASQIAFSTPYLTSSVRMLAPRDRGVTSAADLAGRTVCIVDGTNLLLVARTYAPETDILRTRTWSDCLMATQQFQADAILADDPILAGILAQDPYAQLVEGSVSTQYYGVGIRKGQDDLVRQVNSTIERVRSDGTWRRLYSTWLAGSIAESAPPPLMYRKEEQ